MQNEAGNKSTPSRKAELMLALRREIACMLARGDKGETPAVAPTAVAATVLEFQEPTE